MFAHASELLSPPSVKPLGQKVFCFCDSGEKGPWMSQAQAGVEKGMLQELHLSEPSPTEAFCLPQARPQW